MTKNTTARLAGFVYLLLVLTGIFNLMYVPTEIMVFNDSGAKSLSNIDVAATISSIKANKLLFRSSILVGVFSYVIFLILPFVLFELFRETNKKAAVLMVVFAAFSVPITIYSFADKLNLLAMLSGADYLSAISTQQLHVEVMLFLKSYYNGLAVAQVFWGLWLFPFGYLAFKSGYVPKLLGIALMLGCIGYLIVFSGRILFPEVTIPGFVKLPATIGEIGTCLWLLIMGVRQSKIEESVN